MSKVNTKNRIDVKEFYGIKNFNFPDKDGIYNQKEVIYSGRDTNILNKIIDYFKINDRDIVYLVGEIFDNKWNIFNMHKYKFIEKSVNLYRYILYNKGVNIVSPYSLPDIEYQINKNFMDKYFYIPSICINSSSNKDTIEQLSINSLSDNDNCIHDLIRKNDTIIFSFSWKDLIGINTDLTFTSLVKLIENVEKNEEYDKDALSNIKNIFCNSAEIYLKKLVSETKPEYIIVCMIHYFDEVIDNHYSHIQTKLLKLKYYKGNIDGIEGNVNLLKQVYKKIFEIIKSIKIDGTEVIHFPIYEALDSTNSENYIYGIYISIEGGKLLAEVLTKEIKSYQIRKLAKETNKLNNSNKTINLNEEYTNLVKKVKLYITGTQYNPIDYGNL
jgi:hypothetical protein